MDEDRERRLSSAGDAGGAAAASAGMSAEAATAGDDHSDGNSSILDPTEFDLFDRRSSDRKR